MISAQEAKQQEMEAFIGGLERHIEAIDDRVPHGYIVSCKVHKNEYTQLFNILASALDQASEGKGAERHGQDLPFEEQPMQRLIQLYGVGFALGQAAKKSQEALRLPTKERQVAELLGAINYLAGAVIALEKDA